MRDPADKPYSNLASNTRYSAMRTKTEEEKELSKELSSCMLGHYKVCPGRRDVALVTRRVHSGREVMGSLL